MVGDAISMGVGDYLSEKAEIEYINAERARELWFVVSICERCGIDTED